MQVSMQALSKLLEATDSTIVRWIKKRGLPAQEVGGQYRVNRTELLEWATANGVRLALDLFDHLEANAAVVPTLNEALQAGGIHYGLQGSTREEALRALVQILPLPEGIDPELLLSIFLARELSASTGIGDGIAIPHVRNPIVLHVSEPSVTLAFLDRPVEFGASTASRFTSCSPSSAQRPEVTYSFCRGCPLPCTTLSSEKS